MNIEGVVRWFEELPMEGTTGIMASLGVPIAIAACIVFRRMELRWIVAIITPFVVAFGVYWCPPLMRGGDLSEYVAWAPIFVGIWGAGGAGGAAVVVLAWSVAAQRITSRRTSRSK